MFVARVELVKLSGVPEKAYNLLSFEAFWLTRASVHPYIAVSTTTMCFFDQQNLYIYTFQSNIYRWPTLSLKRHHCSCHDAYLTGAWFPLMHMHI